MELINTITSFNSKNSFVYDSLSNQIINFCSQQISKPLTYICNKSLSQGIFPEQPKYVIVNPLFKDGDRTLLANYRLISLQTGFSKLFKILMFWKLTQHLQAYLILIPQQYGFQWELLTRWLILSSIHGKRKLYLIFCMTWQGRLTVWLMSFCYKYWNIMVYGENPRLV